MKITIEIKNPSDKKDIYWLFHRLQEINEGTGILLTATHNSKEKNEHYFDGDGGQRINVTISD